MPYEMPSNNILPGILGVMAAIKQGKIAKQQRDLDTQYKQAEIGSMQASQKRQSDQDTLNNTLNGIGPDGKPIPIPAQYAVQPTDDPKTAAMKMLAAATYLDSKGARNLANQYRQTAMTGAQVPYMLSGVPLRQAQTGLTQARTTTEQQRPGLIKAQTQYTKAGVPLRNAQTKRITTIQPQQFQESQQNAMIRQQNALEAAQERAAAAQAAAWDRMRARLDFDQQQQQRSFKHSDSRRSTTQNDSRNRAQAQVLRTKVDRIMKANPGVSMDQIRDAARKDGYSDDVINLVLPRTPGEKNFKKTSAKGTTFGWGTP